MFSLQPTKQEINDTLNQLVYSYPNPIKLAELTRIIFGTSTEIQKRKVRLAITELRKLGYLIIGERGYSLDGSDPAPVIEFINKMYSRANNITKTADIMFHGLKQKYGDAVSEKVQQMPGHPMLIDGGYFERIKRSLSETEYKRLYNSDWTPQSEPPFRKSIDARGNEIALQFEADA